MSLKSALKSPFRAVNGGLRLIPAYDRAYRKKIHPALSGKAPPSATPKPAAKKPAAKKPVAPAAGPQLDYIKELYESGEFAALARLGQRLEEGDTITEATWIWRVRAELAQGNHEDVMAITDRMVRIHNLPEGHFFRAQSHFVRGQYQDAMREAQLCIYKKPAHADAVFLLADTAARLGDEDLARAELERLGAQSKRHKTWLELANMVKTDADMVRLLRNWQDWKASGLGPKYHKDVSEYIALGALRCGNTELALEIWRRSLFSASRRKGGFTAWNVRTPSYSSERAEEALKDINEVFSNGGIDVFLVSGTLLGCVRENQLLGHDKDIDVGIWENVTNEQLMSVVEASGRFFVLKSRSPEIVRLKHVNGIAIDVFYHFREPDNYWHSGVKMKWNNTPFKLVTREFLGVDCLIPEDYDLYLSENYGTDWREPKIAFDSAFDTPNGEVLVEVEMVIHAFRGLLNSCIKQAWPAALRYLDFLVENGEEQFVEAFEARLRAMKIDEIDLLRAEDEVDEDADLDADADATDPTVDVDNDPSGDKLAAQ